MKKLLPLVCLWCLLWAQQVRAITTAGATLRNVSIDGQIGPLAAPGTNNGSWEADEFFPGFTGATGSVRWYLTWDDNNIYVARAEGNNSEGSLIYIRAEYPGAAYTNVPFEYDRFSPNAAAMNGVNFIAYIKDGYREYRTWDGTAWSSATANSFPAAFGNVSGLANMETSIPWSAVTRGGTKPSNIRVVMYQVTNNTCDPGRTFVYGESPFGNGSVNGPTIGVSDGVATSASQPGGCVIQNAAITRWWGCYPVIAGVSSNGFVAVQPNAGSDIDLCEGTSVSLNGNDPAADAVGTWTVLSRPAAATAVAFANANDRFTTVSGLSAYGEYILGWSINYGGCPSTPDQVRIFRWQNPPASVAGPNQNLSCEVSTTTLAANTIPPKSNGSGGTGTWQAVSGDTATLTFSARHNPTATVSGLGYGPTVLRWRVTNGPACASTNSEVTIFRFRQPTANAGTTINACVTGTVTLAANNPVTTVQSSATGAWTQVGTTPSVATFANSTLFNTTVGNLVPGQYTFRWTVSNGDCTPATSEVTVNVRATPVSNAGTTINICNSTTTTLAANNPLTTVQNTATGAWTQDSGPNTATFADATLFNSSVSNLVPGAYVFRWTVSNAPCASAASTVTVNVYAPPTANAGTTINACVTGTVTLAANDPLTTVQNTATGAWTQVGTTPSVATFANSTLFNTTVGNLVPGQYTFRWTVSNGNCANVTSDVTVNVRATPVSNAGTTINVCNSTTTTLAANNPTTTVQTGATGRWTQVSGPSMATFANENLFNTGVSNLANGQYVFRWTVSNAPCADASSEVTVNVFATPVSNAGTTINACVTGTVTLAANNPVSIQNTATGQWTQVGTTPSVVTFANNTLFNTTVGNLVAGQYTFRWTVSNGNCTPATSEVTVNVSATPTATAGPDQNVCVGSPVTLAANDPTAIQATATGAWTQVSGPNTATFANATLFNTGVSGLIAGNYVFRWTVSNGGCAAATADLTLRVFAQPTANAGADIAACAASVTLSGNSPALVQASATGAWTQVSGPSTANIQNPANFVTNVSGLTPGTYVFRWTVSNGPCTAASDEVTVLLSSPPTASITATADTILCNRTTVSYTGNNPALISAGAFGQWSQSSGPSAATVTNGNQPTATFSNLQTGVYTFRWTVTNPPCVPGAFAEIRVYVISPAPVISYTTQAPSCAGGSNGSLTVNVQGLGSAGTLTYSLNGGAFQSSNVFNGLSAGTYSARVRSSFGCTFDGGQVQISQPTPLAGSLESKTKADRGQANAIVALAPATGGTAPYQYSADGITFISGRVFPNLRGGQYNFVVRDANGCTTVIPVTVEEKFEIIIYNAFTPNGDGDNDAWVLPFTADYPGTKVQIYNMWGTQLYASDNYQTPWDGRNGSQLVPMGTYYYIVEVPGFGTYKGDLTIIY